MFYYVYEKVRPLVNTSLFTLKLLFCPNSLRMTPKSQRPELRGGKLLICVIISIRFKFVMLLLTFSG